MARRRLHHHAVGALVAEGAPLDEVLAEGGERLLSGFAASEIAGGEAAQCILLRELVDRAGGGARLDRTGDLRVGKIAVPKGRGQAPDLAGALDFPKSEGGIARGAGPFSQDMCRLSEAAIGLEARAFAKIAETRRCCRARARAHRGCLGFQRRGLALGCRHRCRRCSSLSGYPERTGRERAKDVPAEAEHREYEGTGKPRRCGTEAPEDGQRLHRG